MPDEIVPTPSDEPAEDETEVVPHSEDDAEQPPWCVGFFA